jgi:hypothetical protein
MILSDERDVISALNLSGLVIDDNTGIIAGEGNQHWSELYPMRAADVEIRSTTQWPMILSFYEYKAVVGMFDLLWQDGELIIQARQAGLHHLLDILFKNTERSYASLDRDFRDFLKTEEWHCIGEGERAKIGVIGRSPILKVRHKYWLFSGEGNLSALQTLNKNWYIEGQCVHVDTENPIYETERKS